MYPSISAARIASLPSSETAPLFNRLKTLIVETMKLDDVSPKDIRDDEPIFGSSRFGLDSIDALEFVLKLEKEFGVKINNSEESRKALASVGACVEFVRKAQPPKAS